MNRRRFLQRSLDIGLFIATLAAVATSFSDSSSAWARIMNLSAFIAMFFIRWWIDDDRNAWMKANWPDLALIVVLSSPLLRMLTALRIVGLVPALRIGTVIRLYRKHLLKLVILSGESIPAALAMIFAVVFIFGTTEFALEHGDNPQFAELQDGLWWAFVTLTTVGYGDITPQTPAGRIIGVLTMVLGIALYSLTIANLTAFIEDYRARHRASGGKPATPDEDAG